MLVQQSIQAILDRELHQLAETIKADIPAVSGRTRDSIRVETTAESGRIFGRQAFHVLERGRAGGKVPKGFYHIILDWAKQKGIQVDNIKSFAYLTAQKIAREGTAIFRQGGKSDVYSDKIPATVETINKQLLSLFKTEITTIKLTEKQ